MTLIDPDIAAPSVPGTAFRLGFFTQVNGAAHQSPRELYAQLSDVVVAAEELGYESVWVGQHHFGLGSGRLPSPLILLAGIAERTRRIELGTAVIVLPLEDPVRLAEDAAVLYQIADGRLNLGVGGGGGDSAAYPAFGVAADERRRLFDEKLTALHSITAGAPLTDGEEPIRLFPPAPGLRDRIWQSAGTPERAAAAAAAGDGLLIGTFSDHPLHEQRAKTDAYLEQWAGSHGNSDRQPRIGALRFTYVGESRESIERHVEVELDKFRREFANEHKPELAPLSTREYMRRVTRYGTAADVITDLREDPALVGAVTHFLPSVGLFPAAGNSTPGADLDIERLELFAREIAPELGWVHPDRRDDLVAIEQGV